MAFYVPFLDLKKAYLKDKQHFDHAYNRVMQSGSWILGPELQAFEEEYASYLGVRNVIGVSNGLDALRLCLISLGIKAGDRVLVPAHTFIATWLAIDSVGAIPVPVEPKKGAYLPGSTNYINALTDDISAVVVVHLYGQMEDLSALSKVCKKKNVPIIEDAAQSHGARYGSVGVGQWGDIAAFSFYPGKNLGAFGDSGGVATNNDELAEKVVSLRNYGSRRRYIHTEKGLNARMDELQAAFLRVRLKSLDEQTAKRRIISKFYRRNLESTDYITLPPECGEESHVWHLYVIQSKFRDQLFSHLKGCGIQSAIHYPVPCYRSGAFSEYGPKEIMETDIICSRILSLPVDPELSLDQLEYVVDSIKRFEAN